MAVCLCENPDIDRQGSDARHFSKHGQDTRSSQFVLCFPFLISDSRTEHMSKVNFDAKTRAPPFKNTDKRASSHGRRGLTL